MFYLRLLQVQVRQKAENKKTFYYLEQLMLKHKAHENTIAIKPIHGRYFNVCYDYKNIYFELVISFFRWTRFFLFYRGSRS